MEADRVLLPRAVPPDPVSEDQIARIRERLLLYADARDIPAIEALAPQLARDVRTLVDHLDALAYSFGQTTELARTDAGLTDQDVDDILYRLVRYENDPRERGILSLALSNDVEPLLRLLDAVVGRSKTPSDPDATIPPFGWTLHVEEDSRARDAPERRFLVSLGHEQFRMLIRGMDSPRPPWAVHVMIGEALIVVEHGDEPIDVLRRALECFLFHPLGNRYRKAGFEATAIVSELKKVGRWLTPAEQQKERERRRQKWSALAQRLQPGLERLLREHGIDAKGVDLRIDSDDPAWVWRPRVRLDVVFDDPPEGN